MKYKFLLLFSFFAKFCIAQHFELNGKASNIHNEPIYLYYLNAAGKPVHDTAMISSAGKFSFKGEIDGPTMSYLSYGKAVSVDDPNIVNFFIDPGTMTLRLSKNKFKDAVITGSETQSLYRQLEQKKKPIYASLNKMAAPLKNEKNK